MEHKHFKIKEVSDAGIVKAIIARLNVKDGDGDVTLPGAFGKQTVTVLPAHDWSAVPLGKGTLSEKGDDVVVDLQLNLETKSGADWHSALKFDLANGEPKQQWSYGFDTLEASQGEHEGEKVQFLKSLRVHEVSPVVKGAGIDTRTLDVKSMKDHLEVIDKLTKEARAVLDRAKEITEMRAKEGRSMSQATRDALIKQLAELDQLRADLDQFLTDTDEQGKVAALFAQYQRTLYEMRR